MLLASVQIDGRVIRKALAPGCRAHGSLHDCAALASSKACRSEAHRSIYQAESYSTRRSNAHNFAAIHHARISHRPFVGIGARFRIGDRLSHACHANRR